MRNVKHHYPKAIANRYIIYVLHYTDRLEDKMSKVTQTYLKNFDKYRTDAKDPFASLWDALAKLIDVAFSDLQFIIGIDKMGKEVSIWNDGSYNDKIFQLIGYNDIPKGKKVKLLNSWTKDNVSLIKNVSDETVNKLQNLFIDASREGTPTKEIETEVKKIFGGNDGRYKLITDDQIGKLNGNLDRIKQEEQGVEKYKWQNVGDLAVRSLHDVREGKRFSWDDPPSDGHPGQPIRCRCRAVPVLDDIFGKDFTAKFGLEGKRAQADWLKEENKLAA